jgi:hypothetical protein
VRLLNLSLPLLLLLWGCDCGRQPAEAPLATLVRVQGEVFVSRGEERRAGRPEQPLFAGETLVTGPASSARVRYINGVEVEVEENSRFRVNGTPGALTLELEEGRILSTAPADSGTGLTVVGRFGRAELVTAAEMVFDLRSEDPRLSLQYGDVRVLDAAGKPVPVVAGEELELTLGKPRAPPSPVVSAQEIVFSLKPRGGKARVRGAQEPDFTEVLPGQSRELTPGSAFEVPAKATARLGSDSLRVELSGESAGKLTAASRQGEQRTYALQMSRGQARLHFAPGRHRLALDDARGVLELQVSEQSTLSVDSSPEGARVSVLTGQVALVAGGKSTPLKAGEVASRSGEGLQVTPGPAPALLLPPDARVHVSADALPSLALRLPPSSGPLRVEVATEPTFQEPLLAGRVGGEELVRLAVPSRGELHWRFLAEDGSVRAQGSGLFQPERGPASLEGQSPRADILDTGLKATVSFQGAVPALHFRYSAHEGARSYRLRIYRAQELQKPLLERQADRTQYNLEPGALGEGSYLWYVAALGPSGEELTGGRMNKLELVYDNARRELALRRPRTGERVGAGPVLVEGVAPLGARLFVNEQPVALDAKGRFSQRVPPAGVLVFRLVSAQGESYWVRTLRSDR